MDDGTDGDSCTMPCTVTNRIYKLNRAQKGRLGFFCCSSEMAGEEYTFVTQPQGRLCMQTFRVKT